MTLFGKSGQPARMALLACLAVSLAGCGGHESHTVSPGTEGSLLGVDFSPPDHALFVDQNVNPVVYWHDGYAPPSEFTVALKKVLPDSDTEVVMTELKQTSDSFQYRLEPVSTLDAQSVYFIFVYGGAETEISMFLTGGSPATANRKVPLPAPPGARYEHRVVNGVVE